MLYHVSSQDATPGRGCRFLLHLLNILRATRQRVYDECILMHFADVHSIVYYVLLCIVYTTFEIQDYSFYMHYYERIVVHLTTFSASNCQAHHTGFAKVGQLRMNLKRCRRGALPFSSATNDDLWQLRKVCWNGYINVCMICSRHLLFSFLRIFWCSHRPKESASPFNHIFPFAASLIWWGFATVDQRLQWSFHQILVRSPAALMNLLNDALPRPQEF